MRSPRRNVALSQPSTPPDGQAAQPTAETSRDQPRQARESRPPSSRARIVPRQPNDQHLHIQHTTLPATCAAHASAAPGGKLTGWASAPSCDRGTIAAAALALMLGLAEEIDTAIAEAAKGLRTCGYSRAENPLPARHHPAGSTAAVAAKMSTARATYVPHTTVLGGPMRSLGANLGATRTNDFPARRTSADKRLAIMPGREPIRTMLNAIQVTTEQKAGCSNPSERASETTGQGLSLGSE